MPQQTYLGDGLYAEYDGDQFRLFVPNEVDVSNEFFLDPQMLKALVTYAKNCGVVVLP